MILDDPKLRNLALVKKIYVGALGTLGTLAFSALVPMALNTILNLIQKKSFNYPVLKR